MQYFYSASAGRSCIPVPLVDNFRDCFTDMLLAQNVTIFFQNMKVI